MSKQASAEAELKQLLLKAAANYIIAKDSGDAEFCKAASADLAAVITERAMLKQAKFGPLRKGLRRVGSKLVSENLGKGGLISRAKGAIGRGMRAAGESSGRVMRAADKATRGAVIRGRQAGRAAAKHVSRHAGKYGAGAGAVAGLAAGRASKGDESEKPETEEKTAALRYLLGGR